MGEIKTPEMNEVSKTESENFKNIQPENGMNVESAKGFWDGQFEKADAGQERIFSTQEDLKDMSSELKDSKPEQSPNLDKWIDSGGQVRIEEKDGKQEWTFINAEGIEVPYPDGYPKFPPETKHPFIGDIDIGSFTGDREKDKQLYKEKLCEEYGLTEIPSGYVVHHDARNGNLQLVKKEYHEQFTHQGGHSKYKEGAD